MKRAIITVLALAACGRFTVIVTASDGSDSGPATTDPLGSPGSGGTGPASGEGGSSSVSDSSTGPGPGSNTTGGPTSSSTGPECGGLPPEAGCGINQSGLCVCGGVPQSPAACGCEVCGDACNCVGALFPVDVCDEPVAPCAAPSVLADERCGCDFGGVVVPIDPVWCGCYIAGEDEPDSAGECVCDAGSEFPPEVCGWPCTKGGVTGCICGNFPVPDHWCDFLD